MREPFGRLKRDSRRATAFDGGGGAEPIMVACCQRAAQLLGDRSCSGDNERVTQAVSKYWTYQVFLQESLIFLGRSYSPSFP